MAGLDLDHVWASMVEVVLLDLARKTVVFRLNICGVGRTELRFEGVTELAISRRNSEPWEAVELTEIAGSGGDGSYRFTLSFFGDADRVELACSGFHESMASGGPDSAQGRSGSSRGFLS